MSTITLDQRRGTPFDQLVHPEPKPQPVVRLTVPKPRPKPNLPKPRMNVVAPVRTLQQRQEALKRANSIRCARADLKQEISDGRKLAADVLETPPEFAGTMKVIDLLLAMPRVGIVKARAFLKYVDASESKTLGGMSDRQRTDLVALLRGRD